MKTAQNALNCKESRTGFQPVCSGTALRADSELQEDSVIRNFRITAYDGKIYNTTHLDKIYGSGELDEISVIQESWITAELAKAHAEAEFEKYRITQDRLFESDFDRLVKALAE